MFFARIEKGCDVFLALSIIQSDVISYQIDMINQSDENLFLPILIKDQMLLEISSLLPLDAYLRKEMVSFECIKIYILQLITGISEMEQYLLDVDHLVIDLQYLYYDAKNQQIKIPYLPIKSYQLMNLNYLCKKLFLDLVYRYIPVDQISASNSVKAFILFLQDEQTDLKGIEVFLSAPIKVMKIKKKSLFEFKKKHKTKRKTKPYKLLEESETVMISESEAPQLRFNGQNIMIDKDSFLIGRSEKLNDLILSKALNVGRVHAEIIKEAEACYLVDLETKNGTFVNDEQLISHKRVRLHSGDVLKFATEKVVFK